MADKKPLTYAEAGVSFEAEAEAIARLKSLAQSTYRPEVLSDVGNFGGLFALQNYAAPVLVSSTDSVGTKLKIAFKVGRHDTVGFDIVAHCGNDIVVQGAEPLFFLDYIGISEVVPAVIEGIVTGLTEGCKEIGCALIGGEIAELPDLYKPGEYDLVGTIVGAVEKADTITGERIAPGDHLLGLAAAGIHTNGFSLVRRILFDRCNYDVGTYLPDLSMTVGDALLVCHKSYVSSILSLRGVCDIKGLAHITGGGLPGNVVRILPDRCTAHIQDGTWEVLPIFRFLQARGDVEPAEMYRVFNMGIGMVVVVGADAADNAVAALEGAGETVYRIGEVRAGEKGVQGVPT